MVDYKGNGGGIPRNTVKIFANNSANSDCSVFGSKLKDGNSTYSKNTADIQNTEYEVGWRDAVISTKNYPLLSDMNAVLYTLSQQIAGIYQHGVPSYDSSTVYYTYDICSKNGILYIALDDNFSGKNPETETDYWAVFYDPDSSLTAGYNIFLDNSVISASGKYPYSFNSGNIDSSGNADLISYSGSDVSYKIGSSYPNLTGTQAYGQQFTIDSLADDDVSALTDGDYIKFIGSDDTTDLLKNKITVAKVEPSTPSADDVWINNSVSPLSVKKCISPNYTEVGSPTISADGILYLENANFFVRTPAPDLTGANTWKISCDFIYTNGTFVLFSSVSSSHALVYAGVLTDKMVFSIGDSLGSGSWALNNITGTTTVTKNIKHHCDLVFTGTNYAIYLDGNLEASQARTEKVSYASDYTINIGANRIGEVTGSGEIDLNSFKIYANDELVYQPNVLNRWQPYDKIPLGKITVSSGAVTDVETLPYNIDYIGAGGAMPSLRFDELTVLASGGEYTAPSNGYFYFGGSESAYFQIGLKNSNLGMQSTGVSGYGAKVFCPIRKGEVITFRYNTAPTQARFVYAQDSESEAI